MSDSLHEEFITEVNDIQSAVYDEREQSLQERRFVSIPGAQWEDEWGDQFENKPKPEVNKILLSLIRIYNEYRNNRITADFISKKGEKGDELADTLDGLYRADKEDSNAQEAEDNAFDEGTAGGFGALRLRAIYEDEEDEDSDYQRIAWEAITDADKRVFFDLGAKRQDKSDAKRCYVLTPLTKRDYEEEYGEEPQASLNPMIDQSYFDWVSEDVFYVAEVYKVEQTKKTIFVYRLLNGDEKKFTDQDFGKDEGLRDRLEATGAELIREKKVKRQRVHKYVIDGNKILEDCGFIAGPNIPIIPFYGKRWFIDGIERFMGHVRPSMDVQRIKNTQYSKLVEFSSMSSFEKPIFTPEQIGPHGEMWARDNIDNYSHLFVEPIVGLDGSEIPAGPLGYTKLSQLPQAVVALMQFAETDMQDILGNQANGEKIVSNVSEGAVERIQDALGMQTYIYISNFAKMEKRTAEVWLGMSKELLVEDSREMKTIGSQKEVGNITINRLIKDEDSGETRRENDISNANHDISITIGPSSSSRRKSMMTDFKDMMAITQDPQDLKVLSALTMMNMEGEGISEANDYYRQQLVQMGVVKPTEDEAKELAEAAQNQPPDPNTTLANALAEEAQGKAQKSKADTVLSLAKAEETKAKTAETLAGIDREGRKEIIETVNALQEGTAQPQQMGAIDGG
jgi:hypothetical protein